MSMPMGAGPGGQMDPNGGGMGGGMGPDALAGPMGGNIPGGQPNDDITQALMSSANPMMAGADLSEHAIQPGQQPDQMSVQQLLTMLALMQGGIPSSGMTPPGSPGSSAYGMQPPMM